MKQNRELLELMMSGGEVELSPTCYEVDCGSLRGGGGGGSQSEVGEEEEWLVAMDWQPSPGERAVCIPLVKGRCMRVKHRDDEDWWFGDSQAEPGVEGYFPSACLEVSFCALVTFVFFRVCSSRQVFRFFQHPTNCSVRY